jgi:TonB family protein
MLNTDLDRRPVSRSRRGAAAALLLAASAAIAAAQAPFATVSGSVSDAKGGIIQGVTLTLSHIQSQAKHQVKSDATGQFEMVGLPAGEYVLETNYAGFASARDTFSLSAGQLMPRRIVLQVGTLQETITVIDADAPRPAGIRRAAAPAPKPCAVLAQGGRIVPPLKLVDVRPVYPLNLRPSRAAGVVAMEATIGTDGSITATNVVASPYPDMSAAAVEAVRQWQFSSTLLNCAPVEVHMNVSIAFQPQP